MENTATRNANGNETMTRIEKNAAISLAILTLIESGVPARDAVDTVLGSGTFDAIASDVYDALTK